MNIEQRNQIQQIEDLKSLLNSEGNRRFLWRILSYCGIYRDLEGTYEDMLKQSGRRQVGLYMLGLITDTDEEKLFLMMKEAKNKEQEDNHVRRIEAERDTIADEYGTNSHDYDSRNALSEYI